jgi:peptidoglycan hydrolase FlgJ
MHVSPLPAAGSNLNGAPATAAANPRLISAAHEFEASLMQEFLKPLQHDSLFSGSASSQDQDDSIASASSDDDEGSGSDGALMSFAAQAMAKGISERGGFGIATKILDHFRTSPASDVRGSSIKL